MNMYYNLLNKGQIDNIYKYRKRELGKYFAIWSESSHLNKFMITLSPIINTLDATIELRKNFFDKLNNIKHYHKFEVAYFSAIEIGLNKNPPSKNAQISEETRMKLMQKNFHLHIQILTDMKKSDLETVINRMNNNLFHFNKVSSPIKKNVKYDYVVKDIKNIDFKLQYILKTQYKGKQLHTCSRKEIANYIITKLWSFMKMQYKDKWNKIDDKYSFILDLKEQSDLILWNLNNTNNFTSIFNNLNINLYDEIIIKNKSVIIYVKKAIL